MHTLLDERIKEETLPQTLLFVGADLSMAKEFAKRLLGSAHVAKIDSGNHPDLHIYIPEEKSDLHAIASMRQLIDEMALPPFESPRKIFVIQDAEKMLPSSSNALLKTLEEPPSDALIVLLSNAPEALLPTIRSRCTSFRFKEVQAAGSALIEPLLHLALAKDYAGLLQALEEKQEELAELPSQEFFEPLFAAASKRPFKKVAKLIEEAQLAEQHNVKRRTLLLNFLLSI